MLPPTDEHGRFLPTLRTALTVKRVFAKLIDAIVAGLATFAFTMVLPLPMASFVCMTWFCLTDWAGSPGKWLFQVRAVTLAGAPLGPVASLKRNLLLGLPTFLRALTTSGLVGLQGENQVWDRGFMACVSLSFMLGEVVGMLLHPQSRRWGDQFARSRVVDR